MKESPGIENTLSEEVREYMRRYHAAMHAVQSGVAMMIAIGDTAASPKHLRTGVNSALVDTGALVKTLLEAGVITEKNYFKNLCEMAELEKQKYELECSEKTGKNVRLA